MTLMEAMIYAATFSERYVSSQSAPNSAALLAAQAVRDFRKVDLEAFGPDDIELHHEAATFTGN